MAKKQHPFLPMFVGDFFAATAEWEGEEEALYALLLMRQWALGHLPAEVAKLARLVKYDQRNFERWWPTVSTKFEAREVEGFGPRLVNSRLEQHRAKSLAISEKNAQAGKKGAESKWRNDGERHSENMADATRNDGERQKSANGVTDGNPSHPIPSHPDPSQVLPPSPQASCVRTPSEGAIGLRARAAEGNGDPGEARRLTVEVQAVYPAGTYRASNWMFAEREIGKLLDAGERPENLLALARAFAAQQVAKGSVGTQFVLSPEKFFGPDGHWRGPFPLPAKSALPSAGDRITWRPDDEPAAAGAG